MSQEEMNSNHLQESLPWTMTESKLSPYKPGASVLCQIESTEPGGYMATILGIGGPPLANPESDAAPILKAFVPSSQPLEIGEILPATFVCMHGNRALMTFAYMLGTSERVQQSTACDEENAFSVWVDSCPPAPKLRRAIDLIMPSLSGKLIYELRCADCDTNKLLQDLELAGFTGTIKARSESEKSRSAMLIYKGRIVGALFGKKDFAETESIDATIHLIRDNLTKADTLLQVYELPEHVIFSMSALFIGCHVENENEDEHENARSNADFIGTTLISMQMAGESGCIAYSQELNRPDILLFVDSGNLVGSYNCLDNTYQNKPEALKDLLMQLKKSEQGQIEIHLLPEHMLCPSMTFGYKLTQEPMVDSNYHNNQGSNNQVATINTELSTLAQVQFKGLALTLESKEGIATLWFDSPGNVNSLSSAVLEELKQVVDLLEENSKCIKVLLLASRKNNQFISGADLHEILSFTTEAQALALSSEGQATFNRLEALPQTVIACIHGTCLGGGLETTLCAKIRLATNHTSTLIGLPEVRLGLIPGLGGTQRLPRLIPVRQALEFILTSETAGAHRAKELGIIDEICGESPDELMARAEEVGRDIINGVTYSQQIKETERPEKLKTVFATMERSIRIRLKGHYPAPIKAIAAVKHSVESDLLTGLDFEAKAFAELAADKRSSNLIQLFFSQDFIVRSAQRSAQKVGATVTKLGIIGSGTMGLEIAKLALSNGLKVCLKTSSTTRIEELKEYFANHSHIGNTDKTLEEMLTITGDYQDLADCDMVLEAILENPELKRQVLTQVESVISQDCVILTNTSSIELLELGQDLKHPERFAGTHFFYPADKMQLVEVINHPSTNQKSQAKALALITSLGKVPVSVKDSNGFLVNRLLTMLLSEAGRMLDEGTPVNWIEDAAIQFGLPMGPFCLIDELGLDLCFSVSRRLHQTLGKRFTSPDSLHEAEKQGLKGKYFKNGFYTWDESGRKGELSPTFLSMKNVKISAEKATENQLQEIQDRLIMPLIDEASRCLEEKVVKKPRELDLALVVGTGFPSFSGGPLRLADSIGIAEVIEKLEQVYRHAPAGRTPSRLLQTMLSSGRRFYSTGEN
jgi:3-hydroxyacyl-CoA dehydrogenase/enoyl-CoA hydratase/3-hydroxybutyryl-CoA epimerase